MHVLYVSLSQGRQRHFSSHRYDTEQHTAKKLQIALQASDLYTFFFLCMKLTDREEVCPHTESSRLLKGIRINLLLEVLTEYFNYVIYSYTKPDVV